MKNLLISVAVSMAAASAPQASDQAALAAEGKALMGSFAKALQAELMAAVQSEGAPYAIAVCNTRAPEIAVEIPAGSGWTVARSSHKLRNPDNAPDAYTAAVIQDFLARQSGGEAAADMVKAEIVEEDGQQVFRMVKAIPTGGLCLNCHGGDQVKPAVVERLAELYPDDAARGFTEGEMRGVFTLSKPLN